MEPLPYSRAGRLFYMGINMIINNKNNTIISTIPNEVDILENDIRGQYPDVLEILLIDQTTKKNIFWATDSYQHLEKGYEYNSPILPELITGERGYVIMPRVEKNKALQKTRVRDMAEVFTPSWVCNAQNNLIDNAWFGFDNVFNAEIISRYGSHSWETNLNKIIFPKNKTWKHYTQDTRLEIACGEAPYVASRYDTTTGVFISVENRIGLLDRKLRIINENIETSNEWLKATQIAFKNIYAFEWQGDSLLLAREAMFFTFLENYLHKFDKQPPLEAIKHIAYIISWNVWQMDGLKGTIPNSCSKISETATNLFGEIETTVSRCEGCKNNNIKKHNGIYCIVKDWSNNDSEIRFVDLIK